jgi:predicted NUDIX family phosphoesterase
LHRKYSVGIGGHVEKQDYIYQALIPTIHNAIYRELSEEFLDFNFYETELAFLGVINEELTEVGHTHIGFVYLLNTAKQFAPGKELDNLEWLDIADIYEKDLELWSKLALELM